MTKVKYVGPFDAVDIFDGPEEGYGHDAYWKTCKHGEVIEVSPALAKRLADQPTNWEVTSAPKVVTGEDSTPSGDNSKPKE